MFFRHRIRSIGASDRVLDIGPGSTPYPRADVFLEKRFATEAEATSQRGHAPALADINKTVFYDGGRFPFKDREFDYVICSHVLEHVEDVDEFVAEITRVGRRGYLEFPTMYYDYIYDFPEHTMFLLHRDGVIHWMPKKESGLDAYRPVTRLFYESLKSGRIGIIEELKEYFFQGFEWSGQLVTRRATQLQAVTYAASEILFQPRQTPPSATSAAT